MIASEIEWVDIALPSGSCSRAAPDPSDEVLMQEVVQRRADALCLLYARYEDLVIAVARRVLLDVEDAQETLQDVFLSIWNHPGRFDAQRGKFKGWIGGLTHCRAIDRFRRRRKDAAARETVCEELARNMDKHFYLFDRAAYFSGVGDDGRSVLLKSVACLPPEQMQAVLLTYLADMSQREIAQHLGVTLGVVKHRLKKGMQAMSERSDCLRGVFAV